MPNDNSSAVLSEPSLELKDYWAIAKRRRWEFLGPFAAIMAIAVALAFVLPATYRSEATFLIQRQSIPQNLVATTVNTYVQEQIQQIRERLVAHKHLLELADKFDLHSNLKEDNPRELVLAVRDAIEVDMVDITTSDPDQAGQRRATIAFTVAFSAPTGSLAQAVTQDLTESYQQFHREQRATTAGEVNTFLDKEATKLADEIATLEKQMAIFKQEERTQLPELMTMNMSLFENTEQQIELTRERIRELEDRINIAEAELALTDPYEQIRDENGRTVLSTTDRLSVLTTEYLRATARYSASHPKVVRLAREIRVLANQAGTAGRADELMNELVRLQEELREAQRKYEDDHPSINSLEKSISALQAGFRNSLVNSGGSGSAMQPNNPRYVSLQAQLEGYRSNLAAERNRQADLTDKRTEYERRLFQTPVVERDYKNLSRDYQNATQKYQELRDKQSDASLAQNLESGDSAEKFVLSSPAFLPKNPESPNRLGIILIAGLLGLIAGISLVTVREYMDSTVRSSRALERIFGAPPLAVIPQMQA